MIFITRYGIIKENYILLYKFYSEKISIGSIVKINICEKQTKNTNFTDHFKNGHFDFTIIMDNQKEFSFTFTKKNLQKAIAFKTRICHIKFCLQE